jgi:hypothetical protein
VATKLGSETLMTRGKGEDGKGEDGKGEDGKGEDGKGEDGKGEDVKCFGDTDDFHFKITCKSVQL